MAKTKEQKRREAQARATANLSRRSEDLMWWVRQHHTEMALDSWNLWTVNTLRSKIASFYDHLRDCGLPHDPGAFYIMRDKVLIAQDPTGSYKRGERKCLYCLQPLGQPHKEPCDTGARVALHEALFIDEKK